jgi:hypothetical protein
MEPNILLTSLQQPAIGPYSEVHEFGLGFQPYFFTIYPNTTFPYKSKFSKRSLPFIISSQIALCMSLISWFQHAPPISTALTRFQCGKLNPGFKHVTKVPEYFLLETITNESGFCTKFGGWRRHILTSTAVVKCVEGETLLNNGRYLNRMPFFESIHIYLVQL